MATATATAVADPPAYPEHTIPEGASPDNRWTESYRIRRDQGDAGLAFEEAARQCQDHGLSLCTESQWIRACGADSTLGSLQTWTLSYAGSKAFVVRGGEAGCSARSTAERTESHPSRVAVCCSRAVAIRTGNTALAFRRASAKRLLDYEQAIATRNDAAVAALYADEVIFLGKKLSSEAVRKAYRQDLNRFPKQWTLFDTCDVSVRKDDRGEDTHVSDCAMVMHRGGSTFGVSMRWVRGGADLKIRQVGSEGAAAGGTETATASMAEAKEGFGFLLQAQD